MRFLICTVFTGQFCTMCDSRHGTWFAVSRVTHIPSSCRAATTRGLIRRASRVTRRDEPCSVKLSAMTRGPLLDVVRLHFWRRFPAADGDGAARAGSSSLAASDRRRRHPDRLRERPAGRGGCQQSVRARDRSSLRQWPGHQEDQFHVQHRIRRHRRREPATSTIASSCWMRLAASNSRPSSTSGPVASCRRATARISTVRTTPITGTSTPPAKACRTAIRSPRSVATTASRIGASSTR